VAVVVAGEQQVKELLQVATAVQASLLSKSPTLLKRHSLVA
jgi:hypothetical protein